MVIFLYKLYIFVWIQHGCIPNTVYALDPKNSVIKRLWCIMTKAILYKKKRKKNISKCHQLELLRSMLSIRLCFAALDISGFLWQIKIIGFISCFFIHSMFIWGFSSPCQNLTIKVSITTAVDKILKYFTYCKSVLKFHTPKFLENKRKWHMQTVQIQLRLLLKDQFDQELYCLPFHYVINCIKSNLQGQTSME